MCQELRLSLYKVVEDAVTAGRRGSATLLRCSLCHPVLILPGDCDTSVSRGCAVFVSLFSKWSAYSDSSITVGLLICASPKSWVWLSEELPQKEEAIRKDKDQKERWSQRRKNEGKQRKWKKLETSRVPSATYENIFFIFKLRKCNYILLFV